MMSIPEHLNADVDTYSITDSAPNFLLGMTCVDATKEPISDLMKTDLNKAMTTIENKQMLLLTKKHPQQPRARNPIRRFLTAPHYLITGAATKHRL